ncbi:SRPBCC family protein [Arthrobacter sp. B6]|uniref:SRPBCC family protein n=1 Tax=Arthrobacter sp. B6 TaxID=1570137 RepID=UPI000A895B3E
MARPAFRRPVDYDEQDHGARVPVSFTDEQVRGPFKSFRHVHEFQSTAAGSIMTDHVEFTAPFGLVGRVVERFVLRQYLERLIAARGLYLARVVPPKVS